MVEWCSPGEEHGVRVSQYLSAQHNFSFYLQILWKDFCFVDFVGTPTSRVVDLALNQNRTLEINLDPQVPSVAACFGKCHRGQICKIWHLFPVNSGDEIDTLSVVSKHSGHSWLKKKSPLKLIPNLLRIFDKTAGPRDTIGSWRLGEKKHHGIPWIFEIPTNHRMV